MMKSDWEKSLAESCSTSYEDGGPGESTLVSEIREALKKIERLQARVTELRGAIEEVGRGLFGDDRWREAEATWWQQAKRTVDAAKAEEGDD
jgi:hypothetical protein